MPRTGFELALHPFELCNSVQTTRVDIKRALEVSTDLFQGKHKVSFFRNLDTTYRLVVSFTPRPLYHLIRKLGPRASLDAFDNRKIELWFVAWPAPSVITILSTLSGSTDLF
jgi:hypothetical protein